MKTKTLLFITAQEEIQSQAVKKETSLPPKATKKRSDNFLTNKPTSVEPERFNQCNIATFEALIRKCSMRGFFQPQDYLSQTPEHTD